MIKALNKAGTEGKHLHVLKPTDDKPTAGSSAGEARKAFPSNIGSKTGTPALTLSFNTALGVLATEDRPEKETNGIQTRKEKVHKQLYSVSCSNLQ